MVKLFKFSNYQCDASSGVRIFQRFMLNILTLEYYKHEHEFLERNTKVGVRGRF